MKTFCFLHNKETIPPEALKLWGDKPITVIGISNYRGRWIYPIIPPSFIKEGGRHTFSLGECGELEKAGKIAFEEIRNGLFRGYKI